MRVWLPDAAVYELKSAQCVPPWALIDGKLLVPGAQPREVFARAFQQLG